MEVWHEQSNRYHTELRDFKRLSADIMERLGKEHDTLHHDLERAGVKVERVEREMEYLENRNPPRPCVNAADRVVEQRTWKVEERRGGAEEEEEEEEEEGAWEEEFSRVSGEQIEQWGVAPPCVLYRMIAFDLIPSFQP